MARNKRNHQNHRNPKSDTKYILSDKSPWAVQEAYKAIRTNLLFLLTKEDCKVIGVTSAMPGDGKSINAINLAISFGQIGKKTLLIDCDLRRPTIASKLRIRGVPGLSDVLIGQGKIVECIHHMVDFRVDVLPSGTIPPDSTWLLQSDRLEVLMKELKKVYEYIIIDLPPVMTVTDALIMSKYCSGYIIVVRHNETDVRAVGKALNQLRLADARVIGFISNAVPEGSGDYYYKYKNKYKYYEDND